MCARTINGSQQLSYWCSGTLIFFECSFMLNVAPVTNAFLSNTWLNKYFFWCFFYILTIFLFYSLFDNVYITYSLCGLIYKEGFKEIKICGVIGVSEFCLFKGSFWWAKKWIRYLIFHFLFTLRFTKKIKFLETFWNLDNKFAMEMY